MKNTKKFENLLNGKIKLKLMLGFENDEVFIHGTSPEFSQFHFTANCPEVIDALQETIKLFFDIDKKKARKIALNSLENEAGKVAFYEAKYFYNNHFDHCRNENQDRHKCVFCNRYYNVWLSERISNSN